ncbi:MAG: polyhydroxyalkanoate synthesis regulator phasin [Parvicella sp.]|jgi:polyhydroxyalkanoate synthesis regulator phasin
MDAIKNIIYAGVGLATSTTEKVKDTITDLVEKGKISDTEGKKIMDDFFKSTENKKDELEGKIKLVTDKITSKFSKKEDAEVLNLKKRIEELESQLATANKKTAPAKKTTTPKSTAKKTVATKKVTTTKKPAAKKAVATK